MTLNSKRNLCIFDLILSFSKRAIGLGIILFLASAPESLSQENDPKDPKPKIHYCSEKFVPIPETASPLREFFTKIAGDIRAQSSRSVTSDEIYQELRGVAARSFFGVGFDQESLPEGLMDWNTILKLDECSSLLKNVNLPTEQWQEYCLENYVPKKFSEIESKIHLGTELKFVSFFKSLNEKFIQDFTNALKKRFQVSVSLSSLASQSIKSYEEKLKHKYRHFYSETELVSKHFRHQSSVKEFNPDSLNGSVWKVTHVIPAFPNYLSQQMLIDTDGIRSQNGIRKLLKIGQFDSSGQSGQYESSKLMSWAREGQPSGLESLELVQKDDRATLILKMYSFTTHGAVLPKNDAETIIPTSLDLITFRCQIIGEPARKLVCNGSQGGVDGFIMIFVREK